MENTGFTAFLSTGEIIHTNENTAFTEGEFRRLVQRHINYDRPEKISAEIYRGVMPDKATASCLSRLMNY